MDSIPIELILEISKWLNETALLNLARVSKRFLVVVPIISTQYKILFRDFTKDLEKYIIIINLFDEKEFRKFPISQTIKNHFDNDEVYKFLLLFDILINKKYNILYIILIQQFYAFCIKLKKFSTIGTLLMKYKNFEHPKSFRTTFLQAYVDSPLKKRNSCLMYLIKHDIFSPEELNEILSELHHQYRSQIVNPITNDLFAEFIDHGATFCSYCKNELHDFINKKFIK
jgi:hypothetical protein